MLIIIMIIGGLLLKGSRTKGKLLGVFKISLSAWHEKVWKDHEQPRRGQGLSSRCVIGMLSAFLKEINQQHSTLL